MHTHMHPTTPRQHNNTHLLLLEGVSRADVCADACGQLCPLEGLRDVVVSTTAQALDDVVFFCFG
jgi:hypothetical protein